MMQLELKNLLVILITIQDKLRPGLSVAVPPIVDALVEDGSTISATDLRRAIRETDVNTIRHLIPPEVDVKDFISIFNK